MNTQGTKRVFAHLLTVAILVYGIALAFSFTGIPGIQTAAAAHLACGSTVTGHVVLDGNLACAGAGLIVGADGTTIDFNSFTISCAGGGYLGSCQGLGFVGIDTDGFNNILIKGPGTIIGFTVGVLVDGGSNINVMNLFITGPGSPGVSLNPRPPAQGIIVRDTECPDPRDTIVNIKGNEIINHREGVVLNNAQCVNVHRNVITDHNSDPVECSGILLVGSDFNILGHNDIFRNGENLFADGGILLYFSDNNVIESNDVTGNFGAGISLRSGSTGNQVKNNQVGGHVLFGGDLSELFGAGVNNYKNNCYTTTNIVPAPPVARNCPKPAASVGA